MQDLIRWLLNLGLRLTLKLAFRGFVPVKVQRAVVRLVAHTALPPRDTRFHALHLGTVRAEQVTCGGAGERVVLYLHGGGYCVGAPSTHRALAAHIARTAEATCFVIDYRLAPEYPFPAALDDAKEAYRALLQQGVAPSQIALAGDSAGGGLALAAALALRDEGAPLPAALVLISPWTDLTLSGETMRTHRLRDPMLTFSILGQWSRFYVGTHAANHPYCSPLFAELRGLPPMLVQVGSEEILLDDSRRLAAGAHAAGVPVTPQQYERLWHVFQVHAPLLRTSADALSAIGQFLRKQLPA